MYFGKRIGNLCKLTLNGCPIEWTDKWPHLGVILRSGLKFNCCIEEKIRKFYRASNHIFRIEGKCDDLLALRLIETHCVPILTYGIEVIFVSDTDIRRQLRVAYNSVFRRIFHYRPWQSVRELQCFLSRPNWEELIDSRTNSFTRRVRNDHLLRHLFFDD